jgi:PAS domain S-box-containing protein
VVESFPVPTLELLSSAPDAVLIVDTAGRIRWCNDATTKLFGYGPGELRDQPVEVLVPEASRGVHAALRAGYEQEPSPRPMGRGRRLHGQRADGSTFVLQIALSPLQIAGEHYTAAVARDMTDWVETERQLEHAKWRQNLAEDRERIASDLHDTVIQELFATGMALQGVIGEAGSERVAQRLSDTIDSIDDIIREVRNTIFRLQRPPEAAVRIESLHGVVAGMAHSLGFAPELRFDGELGALADDPASSLEVVVREGLSNVARHARATTASIEVTVDVNLTVRISDNGVGLPETLSRSSGLTNLSVRARALGGRLDLHQRPGGGTILEWSVPTDATATGLIH